MRLSDDRRGFYLASPFLGIIFFMIVAMVGATIVNENEQQLKLAAASQGEDLIFYMQALDADFTSVMLQNDLQYVLDNLVVHKDEPNLKKRVEDAVEASIKNRIEVIYLDAYYDNMGAVCSLTGLARGQGFSMADVYLLFTFYPPDKRDNVIDSDGTTEMKPAISGYGIKCISTDPELESGIRLKGRIYYLDAIEICKQTPGACW